MVGTKKVSFYFVEKQEENQEKKLTFVAKDENNEIISQEVLDSQFASEFYKAQIESQVFDKEKSQTVVAFKNTAGKTFFKKKFNTITNFNVNHQGVENIQNNFDSNGKRSSTIVSQKIGNQLVKTHTLRPTLLGSQFYNQIISEIV